LAGALIAARPGRGVHAGIGVNAREIVGYGQGTVLQAVEGLAEPDWTRVGVTERWSVQDVIAHLASYEMLLEEALRSVLGRGPTPTLDAMGRDPQGFNDTQVAARRPHTRAQILEDFAQTHTRVLALIDELGPERLREPGTIPWYGPSYALDDLIVYANYAHKREHAAQIRTFRRTR
jgi:uncharacterized protein (TIGR03083 family)